MLSWPTDDPNDFDIGLIKIKANRYGGGFQFNDHVQPVCLAYVYESLPIGAKLTFSGWGMTYKGRNFLDTVIG